MKISHGWSLHFKKTDAVGARRVNKNIIIMGNFAYAFFIIEFHSSHSRDYD
jgi:hypothetical protein